MTYLQVMIQRKGLKVKDTNFILTRTEKRRRTGAILLRCLTIDRQMTK